MTFKAYLDNIEAQTGLKPKDFKALAEKKGLLKPGVKTGEIVAWLKKEFGLGHGHAMAIVLTLKNAAQPGVGTEDKISKLFSGTRLHWRRTFDVLLDKTKKFGPGVSISPTGTYISLLKNKKKFAIVQVTSDRFDVGLKLKGTPPAGRLGAAGSWNAMVTHRVRIDDPKQVDSQLLAWLRQAYEQA